MSDQPLTTNRIGLAADGTVYACTPQGGLVPVTGAGQVVTYGQPITLNRGESPPLGVWQLVDGQLTATIGGATIREVIIQ